MKLGTLTAVLVLGLGALAWQVGTPNRSVSNDAPSLPQAIGGKASSPSPGAAVDPLAPAQPAAAAPGGSGKTSDAETVERKASLTPAQPAAAAPGRAGTTSAAAAERKPQLARSLAQEEQRWDAIQATPEERQRARAIFVKYFELQEAMDEELLEETISKDEFKRRFFERLTREAEEYESVFGAERARKLELESRSATD